MEPLSESSHRLNRFEVSIKTNQGKLILLQGRSIFQDSKLTVVSLFNHMGELVQQPETNRVSSTVGWTSLPPDGVFFLCYAPSRLHLSFCPSYSSQSLSPFTPRLLLLSPVCLGDLQLTCAFHLFSIYISVLHSLGPLNLDATREKL